MDQVTSKNLWFSSDLLWNHRFLLVSMEIKGINKMLHVVISMFIYFLSCFRFKLHFIAYVGYKSEGDIALDDISLSPACFGKLNCFHHVLHFKWEFHKFLHACILPYRGSQKSETRKKIYEHRYYNMQHFIYALNFHGN
jgi:hypothetical protein